MHANRSARSRRSFPEDALPDKWNAFVEINYAFPDPEKINALVDAYATEHNVQNEPIE